jgi:hypothetical protein
MIGGEDGLLSVVEGGGEHAMREGLRSLLRARMALAEE